jgi:cell division protein FtsL
MTQHVIQAYQQAPWRSQIQAIGLFLLALVVAALVAGLYLSISAQTSAEGIAIQNLETHKEDLERQIADRKTQVGMLTSATQMEQRAKALGYQPTDSSNSTYMVIAGYPGRQAAELAPVNAPQTQSQSIIKSDYTESLWEWLFKGALQINNSVGGGLE